ncbi:MAG: DNA repair protein RecN [Ignavibacteriales bacterium]
MLREIYIKNFILIDELRLEFGDGLNVLTGETGAGKSIVVDALELLVGERISSDMVKNTADKSVVEGVFEISPNSPVAEILVDKGLLDSTDDLIIIRREIGGQGRVTNRLNGRTVTASLLKSLADYLVDIHLQHDNQQLLNPAMHIRFLDNFSPEIKRVAPELADIYKNWQAVVSRFAELLAGEKKRAQDLDFVEFQISEIETAALVEGEDEILLQERNRIVNAEKMAETVALVEQNVYRGSGSASALLAKTSDVVRSIKDPFFDELLRIFNEIYYMLEDVSHNIVRFRDGLDFDPARLEEIETRLQQINKLKKKYGPSVADVMDHLQSACRERDSLANVDSQLDALSHQQAELRERYDRLANEVTSLRKEAAQRLEEQVYKELSALAMPGVKFMIDIRIAEPGITGIDEINFLFSANPGEDPKPIARIASGGEISRFILALKTALAGVYQVPVLVFDEIDVGVGGQALLSMADKLYELSGNHQVILVTHSPQIASKADQHLYLSKEISSNTTRVFANMLDFGQRVEEISRMLDGQKISEAAREHARQMLKQTSTRI